MGDFLIFDYGPLLLRTRCITTKVSPREYNSYDGSPCMQRLLAHDQIYGAHRLHGVTHISSEYCPAPQALRLWSVD
jgi:hypothetical protein